MLQRVDEERWVALFVMAEGVKKYTGTSLRERIVAEIIGRVRGDTRIVARLPQDRKADQELQILINSLTLVTPTYDPIGICIEPLAATMNHSCDPNAVVSFDGSTLNVRSLKKISKDEEVLISYVDITDNPWQRQAELRERYFFTCGCVDCSAGTILGFTTISPNDEQFSHIEPQAKALLRTAKVSRDSNASLTALEHGMKLLRDGKVCPVFRQPYASLRQQLAVNLVTAQQWVSAFAQMLKIYFEVDPVLFPQPFHPVRVVHKWTLARLVIHLSSLSVSEPGLIDRLESYSLTYGTVLWGLLLEVEGNVDMSHGRGTRFANTVRRKVEQVKVDMTRGDATVPSFGKQEVEKEWSTMRKIAEDLAP